MFFFLPRALRLLPLSFDQLTRPGEHLRRDRHADLLRGLQIDDELKLCRLLDREVRGLAPFRILST
jgi:hypothetical protein